jgi:hypothetical protein
MATRIAEHYISSWSEFTTFVERYSSSGDWIFRGVSQSSYKLVPKIGRVGARKNPENGLPLEFSTSLEKDMVFEFQRQARPYFLKDPTDTFELLAVGQHHGLPTRLLDWTESILVAAYFAVENAGTDAEPPAIYAMNLNRNQKRLQFILPGQKVQDAFSLKSEVAIYWPPHISPRIPAQRGLFTVHRTPDKAPERLSIEKLILYKGRQSFWLKLLIDKCGVNRASLFPDMDGLAGYMGWRYKWGKLGIPTLDG